MVDIIITLTDEEAVAIQEFVETQNFAKIEDYFKFEAIDCMKLAKLNKELQVERDKFEKPTKS